MCGPSSATGAFGAPASGIASGGVAIGRHTVARAGSGRERRDQIARAAHADAAEAGQARRVHRGEEIVEVGTAAAADVDRGRAVGTRGEQERLQLVRRGARVGIAAAARDEPVRAAGVSDPGAVRDHGDHDAARGLTPRLVGLRLGGGVGSGGASGGAGTIVVRATADAEQRGDDRGRRGTDAHR